MAVRVLRLFKVLGGGLPAVRDPTAPDATGEPPTATRTAPLAPDATGESRTAGGTPHPLSGSHRRATDGRLGRRTQSLDATRESRTAGGTPHPLSGSHRRATNGSPGRCTQSLDATREPRTVTPDGSGSATDRADRRNGRVRTWIRPTALGSPHERHGPGLAPARRLIFRWCAVEPDNLPDRTPSPDVASPVGLPAPGRRLIPRWCASGRALRTGPTRPPPGPGVALGAENKIEPSTAVASSAATRLGSGRAQGCGTLRIGSGDALSAS